VKNYLALYAIDGFSSASSYVVFIGNTPQEAQVQWDGFIAFDPGATIGSGPTRVFWMLNKNVLGQVAASIATALDPFHAPQFTQDPDVARDYGVNSDVWTGTDVNDEKQVKAKEIAQETIAANEKKSRQGALGTRAQAISLAQYLTTIYGILVVLPNPTRELKRLIADLLTAIKKAAAGTITQAEIDAIFAEMHKVGIT